MSYIDNSILKDVTARSKEDIGYIIGTFVPLRSAGKSLKGRCPFHKDNSPSFFVTPSLGIYKCFGCGRSGNAITFLMQHQRFEYIEAIKWLCKYYNIDV